MVNEIIDELCTFNSNQKTDAVSINLDELLLNTNSGLSNKDIPIKSFLNFNTQDVNENKCTSPDKLDEIFPSMPFNHVNQSNTINLIDDLFNTDSDKKSIEHPSFKDVAETKNTYYYEQNKKAFEREMLNKLNPTKEFKNTSNTKQTLNDLKQQIQHNTISSSIENKITPGIKISKHLLPLMSHYDLLQVSPNASQSEFNENTDNLLNFYTLIILIEGLITHI